MSYPTYAPSSRSYDPGDWPVKTFKALDGVEVRILYGNRRASSTFSLSYQNLTDAEAQEFLDHYDQMLGTFTAFQLPVSVLKGWGGDLTPFEPSSSLRFRYKEPPKLDSVKPGVSSVSISLLGVLS